jgi:hypothetical protein
MICAGQDRAGATSVASVEHPSRVPGRVPGRGDEDGQRSAARFVTHSTPERDPGEPPAWNAHTAASLDIRVTLGVEGLNLFGHDARRPAARPTAG